MPRDRFSYPATLRLPLSDGDWIDVKKGLDAGDDRNLRTLAVVPAMIEGVVVDRIDWSIYELRRAALWITDWSLTRMINDKPVAIPPSFDALKALSPIDFDEINQAVYAHHQSWLATRKGSSPAKEVNQSTDSEAKSTAT